MSEDLIWIRHNLNSAGGNRFVKLRLAMGYEGHGVYWALMEPLYKAGNRYAFAQASDKAALADTLRIDLATLETHINAMIDTELIEIRDGFLFSEKVQEELDRHQIITETNRENGRLGGLARAKQRQAGGKRRSGKRSANTDRQTDRTDDTESVEQKKELKPRISLSDREIEELKAEFGRDALWYYIVFCSNWLVSNGKRKRDCAAFLRNWINKDSREKNNFFSKNNGTAPKQTTQQSSALETLKIIEAEEANEAN